MTHADIFVKVLTEISGLSKDEIGDLLKAFRKAQPRGKWDEELPPPEAEKLIADLRSEAPGILAWLDRGAREVDRFKGHA